MTQSAKEKQPAPECAVISEKQFLHDHTMYSSISSWLFAIAGATNIGLLSVLSSKILTAVEQGRPLFKSNDPKVPAVMSNKKYNRVVMLMIAFGGACMTFSNWLESKKVVTEWQLGAGKLQRKAAVAEETLQAANQASADEAMDTQGSCKNWVASVQTKKPELVERVADRLRHG